MASFLFFLSIKFRLNEGFSFAFFYSRREVQDLNPILQSRESDFGLIFSQWSIRSGKEDFFIIPSYFTASSKLSSESRQNHNQLPILINP